MSPEPHRQQPPRRHRWLVDVAVLVAALVVAGVLLLLWPRPFTVRGMVDIEGDCSAAGYSDIQAGEQVEVLNEQNDVIGVGRLVDGEQPCRWRFTVKDVPAGEDRYGIRLGNANRGVLWHDEDKARAGVSLLLR